MGNLLSIIAVRVYITTASVDVDHVRLLRFDNIPLSIESTQDPVQLVVTAGKAVVRKIDHRYGHLYISHVGDRGRNLYAWEALDLFVLLHTDATAIACEQIRWHSWIGGGLFLWRPGHPGLWWPPPLASYLVFPGNGCFLRRAPVGS